ncbi:MAG: response regulator transcription factor [Candidatus Dormibacteraeota bacterium]|uniref:Response regulator transcription factor n=1 Tax=Candidatus Aeolococcus gillhamiae TaxID=3127015 RepID=A0A934JY92_9BACT|nr:response regulator transcription factor [Candidatus Dormibacteraeota bacterium]
MSVSRGRKRILVVEDEENIRETLRYNLTREGYEVSEAGTGTAGIELARQRRPDLILLDLMLPEMTGLEVCRVLRAEMSTPILMLTAKASELDKVVGLQVGADDYVTKPFSLNELLARVAAMLRRAELTGVQRQDTGEIEDFGGFRLDRAARTVRVGAENVHLTPKEFDLLSLLLGNPGRVLSRSTIIHRVWGSKFFGDHKTVDVHIRWLREKFERFNTLPFRVTTVFGVGYRLDRLDAADRSPTTLNEKPTTA